MPNDDKRKHARYPTAWAVEIKATDWHEVLSLSTRDVSRGGLFVSTDEPLPLNTRVEVTLVLPDETVFQIEGEVVHRLLPARAETLGRAPGFGLRFDERYLDELKLLEVMALEELGDPQQGSFSQDYVILPAVLREEGLGKEPALVQLNEPFDGTAAPEAAEEASDTDRHPIVPETVDEAVAAPAVDLRELDEAPAPPPADAELAQSGVYARATLPSELSDQRAPAPQPPEPPGSPAPRARLGEGRPARDAPLIFGIDFGTSFTSIAVVQGERVSLLEDEDGTTLTPSVVCYPDEGEPIVGWRAREKSLLFPSTTFRSPKRLIGRRYGDPRVDPFLGRSPVRTQAGPNGQIVAEVYGEMIAIPQVCSRIFQYVAQLAERATGQPAEQVLLSAPVGFDKERVAIKRAAELAGLQVVGVIDEPIAAAMAYGVVRAGDGLVAVYDFGGGTFDFTVLEVKGGRSTVIGEAGDDWLGGDDFDRCIAEQAATLFGRQYNVDLRKRAVEWERLLMHCEQAKRKLSTQEAFELHVKGIVLSVRGGIDLRLRLDQQIFADLCGPLVERSIEVVASCLELLELAPTDINHLVLTGGVTRIPLVRRRVQEFFKQKARMAVNPEHAIVLGNAIYGHVIRDRRRTSESSSVGRA